MKAKPSLFFTLKIIPEEMEYEGGYKEFFRGIYRLILNHTITIMVVPPGNYSFSEYPFCLSVQSVEEIRSEHDAALLTLINARYSITTTWNAEIPEVGFYCFENTEGFPDLIFTPDKFTINSILEELDGLLEIQNESYSQAFLNYEQIKDSLLLKFIEERIISNPYFGDYDKAILGR